MHIERLKLFCDLVETESFTKAAQLNDLTQSAVSQVLNTLERLLDSQLVERGKNRLRLTPQGEVLYDHSQRIVQSYDTLHDRLWAGGGVLAGKIRLATIYSLGLHVLPSCLGKFLKAHPGVNVRVEYLHASEIYRDVLGGVADMGFLAYPSRDARLEIVPVRKDPLVLICPPQHPLARTEPMRFKSLMGQDFVHFQQDVPTRKAVDKILRDNNASVVTALEFDNVETIKRTVEIGAGVAIVPQATIKREKASRSLAAVRMEGGEHFRPLAVIYLKAKALPPAMKRFISSLKES